VITNTTNPGTSTTFIWWPQPRPGARQLQLGVSTVSNFFEPDLAGRAGRDLQGHGGAGNCSTTGHDHQYRFGGGEWRRDGVRGGQRPGGYAAGTNDLYFRALSPTRGRATPFMMRSPSARALDQLTPNQAARHPGGSYVYTQTLTTPAT